MGLGIGVSAVVSFAAAGREYYRDFRIPQGHGMTQLLPEELGFLLLYSAFGLVATAALAAGLEATRFAESARSALGRVARSPRAVTLGAGLAVLVASGSLAYFVLGHAVVTDDEHVYRFIGQTLRAGSLVAPLPGPAADAPFFAEQFVVINERGRYGKYTIGHPLVLALAQALGVEAWSGALLTALLVWPLAAIARRLLGPTGAALALVLFALSPQVLFTGATYLSQPTSALAMLAGVASLIAAEQRRRPGLLVAAGLCFGFGILVRPLPGALFAAVAVAWVFAGARRIGGRAGLVPIAAVALPASLGVLVVLVQNHLQAGSPLSTGHQLSYGLGAGSSGLLTILRSHTVASTGMSVVSGLLRLNVWLFGWALSLAFLPWARRRGPWALVWAMVAAGLAYRVVAPKVGVGITGPQYLFEEVPLLCLLTADGVRRLAARAHAWGSWSLDATRLAGVLMAATVVSASMFVPYRVGDLARAGRAQGTIWRLVREKGLTRALVFHESVVPPTSGLSWAYFPRCNSPRLDDDVLFVRVQAPGGDLRANAEFWKRRFPERSAWLFRWDREGPSLIGLDSFLAGDSSAR